MTTPTVGARMKEALAGPGAGASAARAWVVEAPMIRMA